MRPSMRSCMRNRKGCTWTGRKMHPNHGRLSHEGCLLQQERACAWLMAEMLTRGVQVRGMPLSSRAKTSPNLDRTESMCVRRCKPVVLCCRSAVLDRQITCYSYLIDLLGAGPRSLVRTHLSFMRLRAVCAASRTCSSSASRPAAVNSRCRRRCSSLLSS